MAKEPINIPLSEKQLAAAISGLLFSCSVNVVSNTNEEYQKELFDLAKLLKSYSSNIKLEDVQFLREDDYEDSISAELFEEFKSNLEVITFDKI